MGQTAGNFYKIKNKWKTKNKLIGWSYIVNLAWDQKAESWFGIWRLADRVCGQVEHLQGLKSYLSFDLLTLHPGQEHLHLGPRNPF